MLIDRPNRLILTDYIILYLGIISTSLQSFFIYGLLFLCILFKYIQETKFKFINLEKGWNVRLVYFLLVICFIGISIINPRAVFNTTTNALEFNNLYLKALPNTLDPSRSLVCLLDWILIALLYYVTVIKISKSIKYVIIEKVLLNICSAITIIGIIQRITKSKKLFLFLEKENNTEFYNMFGLFGYDGNAASILILGSFVTLNKFHRQKYNLNSYSLLDILNAILIFSGLIICGNITGSCIGLIIVMYLIVKSLNCFKGQLLKVTSFLLIIISISFVSYFSVNDTNRFKNIEVKLDFQEAHMDGLALKLGSALGSEKTNPEFVFMLKGNSKSFEDEILYCSIESGQLKIIVDGKTTYLDFDKFDHNKYLYIGNDNVSLFEENLNLFNNPIILESNLYLPKYNSYSLYYKLDIIEILKFYSSSVTRVQILSSDNGIRNLVLRNNLLILKAFYESRYVLLKSSLAIISDNWLFGVGANSWPLAYSLYRERGRRLEAWAHCDILETVCCYGILGTGLIICIFVMELRFFFKRIHSGSYYNSKILILGFVVYCLHSLVEFPFQIVGIQLFLIYYLSLLNFNNKIVNE